MPKPVIVGVHGSIAGAGIGLALSGDIVIAARSSRFRLAYSAIGLTPDAGATFFLPRIIGYAKASELILTNRELSAEEAEHWGIAARVTEDAALNEDVMSLGRRLASGATIALGRSKGLLRVSAARSLEAQLDAESETIAAVSATADFAKGLRAFLARSTPSFDGT